MELFKLYTYSNPNNLPVEEGNSYTPDEELLESLGFSPEDEELWLGTLTEDWNGRAKGSTVISGLTCEGHPFAVENVPPGCDWSAGIPLSAF